MRTYAPCLSPSGPRRTCSTSRRSLAASSTTRVHPGARPADSPSSPPGWIRGSATASRRAASSGSTPTRPRRSTRSGRRGHRRRHADRLGQDPVLRPPGPPGDRRRPRRSALFLFPTKALGRTRSPSSAELAPRGRHVDLGGRPTTATRRRRSAPRSGRRARSWSPTRTCSTRRSCRITPSGSSSSSSCGSSSSTSCTPTAASSAATWRTCSAGCCGICAPLRQPTRSSSAARRRSGTRRARGARSPGARHGSSTATARPPARRTSLLVDPPVLDARQAHAARRSRCAHRGPLPFLRAGRQTIVFGRSRIARRAPADRPARGASRELRPAQPVRGYRSGYLPTERRAIERGLRDGEVLGVVAHQRARARRRHRPPRRRRSWPATRARSRRPGSRWAAPAGAQGTSVAILVASRRAGRPVRRPPPGVPARRLARGGAARPGQPARPARPPPRGHVRAAVRAGRGVRARPRRRPARVPRRGGPRPPGRRRALVLGERELPGLGDLAADGRAGERRDHRHDAGPAARPRRGRPVRRAGPRPRAARSTSTSRVQYHVDRLDWGERKAYVHRIDVDHYTYANRAVTLKPLEVFAEAPAPAAGGSTAR